MDILVTGIYNNLANTPFGGRNCRDDRYRDSLLTISKTNEKIICFTNAHSYQKLTDFFMSHAVNNIEFILLELGSLPFHNRIQEIKKSEPAKFDDLFWHQRCVELMWGKLFMLDHVIKNHPEAENVFWIDAGLCHNDVISPKYSLQSDLEQHISSNPYSLMTEKFIPYIKEFINGKLLAIETNQPHNTPIPEKYNSVPYRTNNGMVGGLFGGNVKDMTFMIKEFFKKVELILENNELYGEENVLSAIVNEHPDMFKIFEFEGWYHEGWAAWRDPAKIVFSNFFDVITKSEIFEEKIIYTTLSIGDAYREITNSQLIPSFLKYNYGAELVIVTDNVEYFPQEIRDNEFFTFIKLDNIPITDYSFPYNIKYRAIELAHQEFPTYRKLVYLDCDCFFVGNITEDLFETKPGFNAVLGGHTGETSIINPQILLKMRTLARNKEELDTGAFRECILIFDIYDKYIFRNFLIEWKHIYNQIVEKDLTHCGECTDILMAARRANLELADIEPHDLLVLRKLIHTTVQGTHTWAIL